MSTVFFEKLSAVFNNACCTARSRKKRSVFFNNSSMLYCLSKSEKLNNTLLNASLCSGSTKRSFISVLLGALLYCL